MADIIVYEGDMSTINHNFAETMANLTKSIEAQQSVLDEMKEKLKEAMEASNVVKIQSDVLTVNYIAENEKENFDKKKFRKDYPDIYDEYVSFIKSKAYIKMAVK